MAIPGRGYQKRISNGLERARQSARRLTLPVGDAETRWVIFSDHHRGSRDRSDDFSRAEQAYHAALGYYLETGYKLALLGDVEEFWKNRFEPVLRTYKATYEFERAFHARGDLLRIWGNHDDEWRHPSQVEKYLDPLLPGMHVEESFLLDVQSDGDTIGQVLLTHGHQGALAADRLSWLTRNLDRYIWRPLQRLTHINPNTPASSLALRRQHGIAMYNWAASQPGLVLIAGHTHHPIFDPGLQVEEQLRELDAARENGDPTFIARTRARLEQLKVLENRQGFRMSQPSYFNTGCCCFADGDITGIELASGMIKLVRWTKKTVQPEVLASADLKLIFERVAFAGIGAAPVAK
jgi:predicted phosphodiesterase